MKYLSQILKKLLKDESGNMILSAMIFGTLAFSITVFAVSGYAMSENRASIYKHNQEISFQIAESGIEYYRWHLAHDNSDFQDGTTSTGPYVHDYKDKNGDLIGYFSLNIIAPATGTTITTIESSGWLKSNPNSKRHIKARIGFPSLTDYSFLLNEDLWIGDSETVHGKMQSNGGIRFDGTADAEISSAKETYLCENSSGCSPEVTKSGVWGSSSSTEFFRFPVPAKDFTGITANLATIKSNAQSTGIYLSSSGYDGWRIKFESDGSILIAKVGSVSCYWGYTQKTGWENVCLDIVSYEGSDTTYYMSDSMYIYAEDTVWVEGVVKGRASVGVSDGNSIIIKDNITYLDKDGTDVLGLIASEDILIPRSSPDDLEINAALLAKDGYATRYYFSGDIKNSITTYGAVLANQGWTWSWVDSSHNTISGYENTYSNYDANLTYGPPPSYPVGSEYNLISWEEFYQN